MSSDARRTHLLDTAQRLFDSVAYDDVWMSQIASDAGVTRALVYHYFPTKADLFAAVWARAHETLRGTVDFTQVRSVRDGLISALVAYLDFYEKHLGLVLTANRSAIASATVVRNPITATFDALTATVLDAAQASGEPRRIAETAFAGWIGFIRESTVKTLLDRTVTTEQNLAICIDVLDATVGRHIDLDVPVDRG